MIGKASDINDFKKYFFYAIIVLAIFLSYKIIKPYIIVLISAFLFSYLVKPLFFKLNERYNKSSSAIICILLLIIIFLIPLGVIIGGVTSQAYNIVETQELPNLLENLSSLSIFESMNIDMENILREGASFIASLLSSAITYIPSFLVSALILFFGIYYILIHWNEVSSGLVPYLPFRNRKKIVREIDDATKNILYGSFLIAIIQFAISCLGFYLSGVELYLLLPVLVFFFAFIPGIGPAFIWIPLAIYYLATQNWFTFIGVIITGIILSLVIDTIFRTKFLGKKSNINPFIMLLGIMGGISVFGAFGIVIGPLILAYTIKILRDVISK